MKATPEMIDAGAVIANQYGVYEGRAFDMVAGILNAALAAAPVPVEPVVKPEPVAVADDPEADEFFRQMGRFGEGGPIMRPTLMNPTPPAPAVADGWRPIAEADNDIAYILEAGAMKIGNSYPVWVRDEDGRVYEALWSDNGKTAYWWDIEGESPVDPVEFMPHPLDPRFAASPATPAEVEQELRVADAEYERLFAEAVKLREENERLMRARDYAWSRMRAAQAYWRAETSHAEAAETALTEAKAREEKLVETLAEAIAFANSANNYIAGQDLPAAERWAGILKEAHG